MSWQHVDVVEVNEVPLTRPGGDRIWAAHGRDRRVLDLTSIGHEGWA